MSDSSGSRKKPVWSELPFIIGVLLTVLVLGAFGYALFCLPVVTSEEAFLSKWSYLKKATPNEIGDTLAGVAGSLAFVWLVVTVWLQAVELREQRTEFEKMADAQGKQVEILQAQGRIFDDEQRQRDEARAEDLLNEKLRSLVVAISESGGQGLCWHFSNAEIFDGEFGRNGEIISHSIGNLGDENLTIDEAIIALRRRLLGLQDTLWNLLHQSIDFRLPPQNRHIPEIVQGIEGIMVMKDELSPPQQERLLRMRLSEIKLHLKDLSETTELWEETNQ